MPVAKSKRFHEDCGAASAVEFAFIAPVFLVLLFGLIAFGSYLGVVHGVQQLTAEAARASIAGLSDDERFALARDNIAANVNSYPMLSSAHLTVQSAATDAATGTFKVTVQYDASDMFIFNLPHIVPMPNEVIVRTAAIQRGGY
ncbi:MAG TPA: TadE/TadG family type IV pilus assembly protein [Pseudolabrys sp.]|nr:TadE/TadG family type IV pilus assembly protein [Pseudolabrys sp.]